MSNKPKHTPGPWRVTDGYSIEATWPNGEVVQVCNYGGSRWSQPDKGYNTRTRQEARANGPLITQAPAGYRLAQMLLTEWQDSDAVVALARSIVRAVEEGQ